MVCDCLLSTLQPQLELIFPYAMPLFLLFPMEKNRCLPLTLVGFSAKNVLSEIVTWLFLEIQSVALKSHLLKEVFYDQLLWFV